MIGDGHNNPLIAVIAVQLRQQAKEARAAGFDSAARAAEQQADALEADHDRIGTFDRVK